MKCRLKKDGIRTVIDVDGKTVEPSAYMSYYTDKKNIDAFKKRGINLFMFPIYAGDEGINMETGLRPFYDNFFKGYGKYDFSVVDRLLQIIAPDGEKGIYIIPRLCIEPPRWWQEKNPRECARDHRGERLREAFTSDKWRDDMMTAVKALIDHIGGSVWRGNVIGYHIAAGGTEEWTYQARYKEQFYDYSEVNLLSYKNFLKEKYKTPQALCRAWGKKDFSFDDVTFPAPVERLYAKKGFIRSEKYEQSVLDYFDFHSFAVSETIAYFCREIKEYTHYERITGAFYGYVVSMPQNKKGLHALSNLLNCPYIDFLSTTNESNLPGDAWTFGSAVNSAQLHNKLWLSEGDIRTVLTAGLDKNIPQAMPDNDYYSGKVWHGPENMFLSLSALKKAVARTLCARCGIWWFDMFGGWFDDEKMLSVIRNAAPLYKMQQHMFFKSEIALIIDETGYKYFGLDEAKHAAAMRELSDSLSRCGAPFDIYLQSDIKNADFPSEQYKLYIFSSGISFPEEDSNAIRHLRESGATLLWLYASGVNNPSLCNFNIEKREQEVFDTAVFGGEQYPKNLLPILKFSESGGYVLSSLLSGEPAVIWKNARHGADVYSLHLAPSPALFRRIALLSGVHLYNIDGDIVYAGGEFIAVHACRGGVVRLNLPYSGCTAEDAFTKEPIAVNDRFIDLRLEKYDTKIVHIKNISQR